MPKFTRNVNPVCKWKLALLGYLIVSADDVAVFDNILILRNNCNFTGNHVSVFQGKPTENEINVIKQTQNGIK